MCIGYSKLFAGVNQAGVFEGFLQSGGAPQAPIGVSQCAHAALRCHVLRCGCAAWRRALTPCLRRVYTRVCAPADARGCTYRAFKMTEPVESEDKQLP